MMCPKGTISGPRVKVAVGLLGRVSQKFGTLKIANMQNFCSGVYINHQNATNNQINVMLCAIVEQACILSYILYLSSKNDKP